MQASGERRSITRAGKREGEPVINIAECREHADLYKRLSGAGGISEAMTYFGTYAVNERDHKLTLHVEYCLFRSCDNTDRTAELTIIGGTMEFISTVDASPTGASYSRIVWKRRCCT